MIARFAAFVCSLLLSLCGSLAQSEGVAKPAVSPPSFAITEVPPWVRPFNPDPAPPEDAGSGGIFYVLVDEQVNLAPRASYYHEARRITLENGVQNGAAITVSFDPSYQKLAFHFVRLIRGGSTIDRLDRSQIKLLQREQEMESFLYDGAFTARCELEDVRIGDVIEYACTIEGANPVLNDKYFDTFATEWAIPVHHAIARIVYPVERPLHFLIKNRTIQPVTSTQERTGEWLWEEKKIAARRIDPVTPAGYNPYGVVQVSEFADWRQVVDWAVPLYQAEGSIPAGLKAEITRLNELSNREERILAALRFVQEEIRYLGIESGVGSHRPTPPGEVLRRRFGDCKDKTLLLATLLRHCGFTATPALVSSVHRRHVAERLPSPDAFNHVILQVENGKDTWWLDATLSSQRGPLSQIYVGNFAYALVLRPGTGELTAYAPPPESLPKRKIVETYKVPAPEADGHLEVTSEFRGRSAEVTRAYFQASNNAEIQKKYLQYYARRFPGIQAAATVEYQELPGENACRVKEQYRIPGIWQINDDKTQYRLVLHPSDVDDEMGTPGSTQRNDPLALNHPVQITQQIHAEMFQAWNLNTSQREIVNALFRFQDDAKVTGRKIQMNYSYQSLADQVSVADLPSYDTALRKLKETLGYTFTYSTPQQLATIQKKSPGSASSQFNWPIAVLLGIILATAIPLTVRYYRRSKLASPLPPSLTHPFLEGIGGWLVLVALGHFVRPVGFIMAMGELYPSIFRLETWQALTQVGQPAYHPLWWATLLFELFYNSISLVLCILLLVLFFKRRAAWPRFFVGFLIFCLVGLVVDSCLAFQIPAVASNMADSARSFVQGIVQAAIWIPYTLTSKRVKATFRY